MSKIDLLIRELCPIGVQFHRLDEVFDIRGGFTPSKSEPKFWTGGTLPWFRMEDIRDQGRVLETAAQMVTNEAAKSRGAFDAESLVISTSATIGEHALIKVPFLANQRFSVLTRKRQFLQTVDPKFAFYIGFNLAQFCKENVSVSNFAGVVMAAFKSFQFPVPPIEVQREIVSILDKFNDLQADLQAELEARSIQYEAAKDSLLDFSGDLNRHALSDKIVNLCPLGIERIELAALGDLYPGLTGKSKADFSQGNSPFVSYLDIANNSSLPMAIMAKVKVDDHERQNEIRQGDLLFTGSSEDRAGVGLTSEVLHTPSTTTYLNSFCFGFRPLANFFEKGYLKHLFRSSDIRSRVMACSNGVTRINISKSNLVKIAIPVPPPEIQIEIVTILDKLETLVNDINIGLPAEIQARRKQYEYYRNKLLTFKELEAV